MSQRNFMAIKAAVYKMGLLFNQQPGEDRINAYAEALSKYTDKQVIFAFNQVIKSGSAFFPSIAEILKHLQPATEGVTDRAPQIAAEMLQMVRWYGKHDEVNMLKNCSPEAKTVFEKWGDTSSIRNSENLETTRAQLERLARSVAGSAQAQEKNEQLNKIGIVIPLKRLKQDQLITSGPE